MVFSDNPVLCDEHLYELAAVLENLSARMSGVSTCVAQQTSAPVLMRALNDILPKQEGSPVIVMAQVGPGVRMIPLEAEIRHSATSSGFQRVGTIISDALTEHENGLPVVVDPPVTLPSATSNVVVKWPDEQRRPAGTVHAPRPLLRETNSAPQ